MRQRLDTPGRDGAMTEKHALRAVVRRRSIHLAACTRLLLAWIACLLLGMTLTACRGSKVPLEPPALCVRSLPAHLAHRNADALPAAEWHALLFKNARDGVGADPVDCSGEPIAWPELPAGCVEDEPDRGLAGHATSLASDDLVVRHAGHDYWFAWAPYRHFDGGMREGPLVIARVREGRLEVRAAGTLRAYAERLRLEVRPLGAGHVLLAHGEHCGQGRACVRATRVMSLDRQRFRMRPLRVTSQRGCLGPAWFPDGERVEVQVTPGVTRVLERSFSLALGASRIDLAERVSVHDWDLAHPALPPRLFREAQTQLRVTLREGELMTEGKSLWGAIRSEEGSTQLRASP